MQLRKKYNYSDGPVTIALMLFRQGITALTDADATEVDEDGGGTRDDAFRQEVSIMSAL